MKLSTKIMSIFMAMAVCFAFMPADGISQTTDKEQTGDKQMTDQTIVEVAAGNSDLSTFVQAVETAGLAEVLQGKGPFTVFAPTNEAFNALPEGKLDKLMKPENKEKLRKVLMNHVVSGSVMSADLEDGQMVETMQGSKAEVSDNTSMINNAEVVEADVEASNGVIHVISQVMVPSDKKQKEEMMEEDRMEETREDSVQSK